MNDERIVTPNEWDIEFNFRLLPNGKTFVICTACGRGGEVSNLAARLIWIKEHRKQHFGETL